MFEVVEPASYYGVEASDDGFQAVAVVALGETADVVFELREALGPWPLLSELEMVAEEIKSSGLSHIHDPCLVGMERQTSPSHRLVQQSERLAGLLLGAT